MHVFCQRLAKTVGMDWSSSEGANTRELTSNENKSSQSIGEETLDLNMMGNVGIRMTVRSNLLRRDQAAAATNRDGNSELVKRRGKNFPPPLTPKLLRQRFRKLQSSAKPVVSSDDEDEAAAASNRLRMIIGDRSYSSPRGKLSKAETEQLTEMENPKPSTSVALVREMRRHFKISSHKFCPPPPDYCKKSRKTDPKLVTSSATRILHQESSNDPKVQNTAHTSKISLQLPHERRAELISRPISQTTLPGIKLNQSNPRISSTQPSTQRRRSQSFQANSCRLVSSSRNGETGRVIRNKLPGDGKACSEQFSLSSEVQNPVSVTAPIILTVNTNPKQGPYVLVNDLRNIAGLNSISSTSQKQVSQAISSIANTLTSSIISSEQQFVKLHANELERRKETKLKAEANNKIVQAHQSETALRRSRRERRCPAGFNDAWIFTHTRK